MPVPAQVTGVRNGGCKYYDTCYFAEIAALFHNSAHTQVTLNFGTVSEVGSGANKVPNEGETLRRWLQDHHQEGLSGETSGISGGGKSTDILI